MSAPVFSRPEDAALSSWIGYAAALARVIEITYTSDDEATVVTAFHPADSMVSHVERTADGWVLRSADLR